VVKRKPEPESPPEKLAEVEAEMADVFIYLVRPKITAHPKIALSFIFMGIYLFMYYRGITYENDHGKG